MAAAAYASLVSLMTVIDQILNHPCPPIILDKEQAESLRHNITLLQDFLEVYPGAIIDKATYGLEMRILESACAAEEVIESRLVDQILGESTRGAAIAAEQVIESLVVFPNMDDLISDDDFTSEDLDDENGMVDLYSVDHVLGESPSHATYAPEDPIESHLVDQILNESTSRFHTKSKAMDNFYRSLQKVCRVFDFLKNEVMQIKERIAAIDDHQVAAQMMPAVRYPSQGHKTYMVGFEDVLHEVLDKLTGQQSSRQIMQIVGMGGIGKTTLARNVYENQLIVHHFDICSWVTISQKYNMWKIFVEILSNGKYKQCGVEWSEKSGENWSEKSGEELGEALYKRLSGIRYLVIMDDMWSIQVWDKIKWFFPDNNNGSRIVITTRMSNMTFSITNSNNIKLNFLNDDQSWKLLCKNVFGEEDCPIELEKVGKKIAKNCKGLPLSIGVISGFLAKSTQKQSYWENIAENLKSILNVEDDEHCLKILYMSYNHLPVHLKPCFLYMGIFSEDNEIRASYLINLWLAEGFVKPIHGKSLEVVAEEYLKELVDRNLILVKSLRFDGKIKRCHIHDLLWDLCKRELEKEAFLCFSRLQYVDMQHGINAHRHIIHHGTKSGEIRCPIQVIGAFPLARSLISDISGYESQLPFNKLLRVLKMGPISKDAILNTSLSCFPTAIFELVNTRFIYLHQKYSFSLKLPPMDHFWNLHTLIIIDRAHFVEVPCEIWKMHQLRHINIESFCLPEPPSGQEFGLWNLQYMSLPRNLRLGNDVVKGIPNIRRLKCSYFILELDNSSDYRINNLCHLEKLECLSLSIHDWKNLLNLAQNLNLPHSLKKLRLQLDGSNLCWDDMTTKLGSLPLLEQLTFDGFAAHLGSRWILGEVEFRNLRILKIEFCNSFTYWVAESIHFPFLEHIFLVGLRNLKEIPSGIGEIPTLQSIELRWCSSSAVASAEKILKEQEDLGNFDFKITVEN